MGTWTSPQNDMKARDYKALSVKWKNISIGYLIEAETESGGNGYFFRYDTNGLKTAQAQGYTYLMGFRNTRRGKVYMSESLFPVFKNRVPSKGRRDLSQKLQSIGMATDENGDYDVIDYLGRTGGTTSTDQLSFEKCDFLVTRKRPRKREGEQISGR